MIVLAIDPGTTESAYVQWSDADGGKVMTAGILPNEEMLASVMLGICADVVAIEMIASYGMPVGKEVFETCVWIGRFVERSSIEPRLVYRRDVKMHHCASAKAKDSNIWQALVDKYGAPGTKKEPGLTFGLKSHMRAAFALATYVTETHAQELMRNAAATV